MLGLNLVLKYRSKLKAYLWQLFTIFEINNFRSTKRLSGINHGGVPHKTLGQPVSR